MKRSLIIPVFLLSGMCLAAGCGSKNNVDLSSAHTTEAETMAQTDEPEPETEETEEPASRFLPRTLHLSGDLHFRKSIHTVSRCLRLKQR